MSDARSTKTWRLVARQHGIVARRQLLALGFSSRAIEHRLARGRLHPVGHGIYAVGWPYLTRQRRWMAAVLAGGAKAALSHRSAAALWEIGAEHPRYIDVSVRRRAELRRPGLRIHGRPSLPASDIWVRDDIPATSPARTLVDVASELTPIVVERAVNDADKRDLIDPETLRSALDDYAGEPGVRPLRALLDRLTFRLSDSDLEIYFRPIATAAKLPRPLSKQRVNGFEVDFFWPELGLVVEADGLRYHRTPSAQARDALRDRTHVIAGMTPLRFTHYEIRYEPRKVCLDLKRAAAMLAKRIRY
ncbi:MAG TPA: type IV toxin-antitoxin system AbiEi family antitoxin domain-containing protein [Solirubrobacterales bacterium]|jgi:very-short-patch-repair endonuclease|nr:type IV toxin-antitoxin system AbiEi family antitoxin domain-containing protein [Solirubrobacterales bacterium]